MGADGVLNKDPHIEYVKGLELWEKSGAIWRFIKKHKIDILLIQKSKREEISASLIREIWGRQEYDIFIKPSEDNRRADHVESLLKSFNKKDGLKIHIIKGLLVNEGVEICLTDVYGPNSKGNRNNLWLELDDIQCWSSSMWCLGGNFIVVRYPSERKEQGTLAYTRAMEAFSDVIVRNELI